MELNRSSVHRGLDVRMKVGSFEALDLIVTLILAALLNLFGLPGLVVIALPAALLLVLYLGKRNKPEGFLAHLIRYLLTPGHYSVGATPFELELMKGKIYEKC
ncbi:MAG: hypothetical protein H6624_15570 [Bdellovibrionaceae bacterium]|nr:hypothetical protein [Pseudobdellovibrionaceae bacterium]